MYRELILPPDEAVMLSSVRFSKVPASLQAISPTIAVAVSPDDMAPGLSTSIVTFLYEVKTASAFN